MSLQQLHDAAQNAFVRTAFGERLDVRLRPFIGHEGFLKA
jgi:hypothetical protein